MCLPALAIPAVVAVTSAVSAATAVGAGIASAVSASNAAARNQEELERSAKLEAANAVDARARGSVLAGQARQRGAYIVGKQRLSLLTSGLNPDSGTPLDLQTSTQGFADQDALTIHNNAFREAWGYDEGARKSRFSRDELGRRTVENNIAFGIQAGGSLLGAASGIYKNIPQE